MLTRHARYRIRVTDHGWSSEEVVAILEDRTTFDSSLKRHYLYPKHDNGRQRPQLSLAVLRLSFTRIIEPLPC